MTSSRTKNAMQHQGCYQDDAVLHPSFLSEYIAPRSFTEARRAGLLSRAPVKSSFIGVLQWHMLAPNSEPGRKVDLACARPARGKRPVDVSIDRGRVSPGGRGRRPARPGRVCQLLARHGFRVSTEPFSDVQGLFWAR